MTTKIIQTNPKRDTYVALRNACIALISVLLVLLRYRMGRSVVSETLGQSYEELGFVFFIAIIIAGIVFHFISRKETDTGKLELSEEQISIMLKSDCLNFKVSNLSSFKIKRSFDDVSEMAMTMISSYDNWVSFSYNEVNYTYQFAIDSGYADQQLNKLIDYWKTNMPGFEVEILKSA